VARPLPAQATVQSVSYLNDQNANYVLQAQSVARAGFPKSGKGVAIYGYSELSWGVYGETTSGIGVRGFSGSSYGVYGTSNTGTGVRGNSNSSHGVYGSSDSGHGVHGASNAAIAVFAGSSSSMLPAVQGWSKGGNTGLQGWSGHVAPPVSPDHTGVFGSAGGVAAAVGVEGSSATGRGGLFSGKVANLRLTPADDASHPATGLTGDLFVDKSGRLWFCKGGSSWVQVA
jgi:hypothetical protein